MKKSVFAIVTLLLTIVSITIKSNALTMADLGPNPFSYQQTHRNPLGDDVHNILLFYLKSKNQNGVKFSDIEYDSITNADWDEVKIKDTTGLIKYCPNDKCVDETFMDTFLILPGALYDVNKKYETNGVYDDGYQIYRKSLKQTLLNLKNVARLNNTKINIILEVSIPDKTSVFKPEFVDLGDQDSATDDDIDIVASYVEDMALDIYEVYEEVDASNTYLNMVGFYWANEAIFGGGRHPDPVDSNWNPVQNSTDISQKYYYLIESSMREFNEWAHDGTANGLGKSFKTLWIPYMATNAEQNKGYSFGFDYVSLQTSHAFKDPFDATDDKAGQKSYYSHVTSTPFGADVDNNSYFYYNKYTNTFINNYVENNFTVTNDNRYYRLDIATEIANDSPLGQTGAGGFGIEFENDLKLFRKAKYYSRFMEWLTWSKKYDNWKNPVNVYYTTELCVENSSERHGNTLFHRDMYDLTYKYATGKLTEEDVTNLAKNKSYTLSPTAYSNSGSNQGYSNDVNGNELTDDIFGKEDYGTEWVALRKADTNNATFTATVDLGEVYNGVYKFVSEFRDYESAGISKPSKVEVFYSTDNTHWKSFGVMNLEHYGDDSRYMAKIAGDPVTARYIKFEMTPGEKTFVFISEIQVYKKKTVTLEKRGSMEFFAGEEPSTIALTNETNGSLKIINDDANVANVEATSDGIRVQPLTEGTTSIIVMESATNSYTTLDIIVHPSGSGSIGAGENQNQPSGGITIEVPNTLSKVSPISAIIAVLLIVSGIGVFIYSKRIN